MASMHVCDIAKRCERGGTGLVEVDSLSIGPHRIVVRSTAVGYICLGLGASGRGLKQAASASGVSSLVLPEGSRFTKAVIFRRTGRPIRFFSVLLSRTLCLRLASTRPAARRSWTLDKRRRRRRRSVRRPPGGRARQPRRQHPCPSNGGSRKCKRSRGDDLAVRCCWPRNPFWTCGDWRRVQCGRGLSRHTFHSDKPKPYHRRNPTE